MTLPAFAPTAATIPDSPLSRWDTRWKLAAFIMAVVGIGALQTIPPAIVALATSVLTLVVARVPLWKVWRRFGLIFLACLPFLVLLPLRLQFAEPAPPGYRFGMLVIAYDGLELAAVLTLRGIAIGLLSYALLMTAPAARTFAAARSLGAPVVLVSVAQLAYRYLFVLMEEARQLRLMLRLRGFRAGTNVRTYRTYGSFVSLLLVRAGTRAEQVQAAMHCRGWTGGVLPAGAFRTTSGDVVGCLAVCAGVIGLILWDNV